MHIPDLYNDMVIHWSYTDPITDIENVHLWIFDLDDDRYIPDLVLSPEELIRSAQINNDVQRRRFEKRCMLLRYVLGNLLCIAPADIRFATGPSGKPRIENEEGPPFHFNLSHSENVLLIGVSAEQEIGVDVEIVRPDIDIMEVAEHYLSHNDMDVLRQLPEQEQRVFFYRCWTAREAVVKANGSGIGISQQHVGFQYLTGINGDIFPLQFELGDTVVIGAVTVVVPIEASPHDADIW